MNSHRELLSRLLDPSLAKGTLRLECADEVRIYTLIEKRGQGATGVAWQAEDRFKRLWAIKFVLQEDYKSHSIEAEAARVAALNSRRVARVEAYGNVTITDRAIDLTDFYGMVVEWIEGISFKKYLSDLGPELLPDTMLRLAKDMCEALSLFQSHGLSHNDLHDDNMLVRTSINPLTKDKELELVVIDSGSLKTEERRLKLIDSWNSQLASLRALANDATDPGALAPLQRAALSLENRIAWWSRTDQEWVVCHICSLYNCLVRNLKDHNSKIKRFVQDLPDLLDKMDDHDPLSRLVDAGQMYLSLNQLWQRANQPTQPKMQSPFEFMSAELIRNDKQLIDLFSDEFPGLDECRSNDPVYLYGPRGCGKSTILRSLSLKAILHAEDPTMEIEKVPFIGVYVSCSSELRSRFWLMPESDYDVLEGHVVRYFNLLLVEELADTLDEMYHWDLVDQHATRFGITDDISIKICDDIRLRLDLKVSGARYAGASHFALLRSQIRRERDRLWMLILDREQSRLRTDAQVIFDISRSLSEVSPVFALKQLAFLLDDYSNQRIPRALQTRLNQAISFAKQGNPVFKVTSEYRGVDLSGIQEGREVREVNVGSQYVNLQDTKRWRFLKHVLERRFAYLGAKVNIEKILPPSQVGPSIPMAKAIVDGHKKGESFNYHGLDTISDLCSGDFAMGLDLVRKIFEEGEIDWRSPKEVPESVQHRAITRYATREHEYIRYLTRGREKFEIVNQLCWLAKECCIQRTTQKDGETIPLIKIHLDITEESLNRLEGDTENRDLFHDLVQKGILFPLDTSKSRELHQGTQRYQIRRVLLARFGAPLGRHTPIRIDTLERLRHLLTEPKDFVKREINDPPLFGQTSEDRK